MTRWPPVGAGGRVAWKPEGSFREFRAIGGSSCRAARRRCRQRPPDIRQDGTPLMAEAKGFRRNAALKMMESSSDLNQPLQKRPFRLLRREPHGLPVLVGLEERPRMEATQALGFNSPARRIPMSVVT